MSEDPGKGRARVLVIENEDDVRTVVVNSLVMHDLPAVGVAGCAEALELMKSERFAAAVVDLGMPNVDGLNCAGKMKIVDPSLPLFAFTAYSEAAKPGFILRDAGFDDCFRKGEDEGRLFAVVAEAVKSHVPVDV